MLAYESRQWELREHQFNPHTTHHHETLFTIGNGFLGVRGSYEESFPGETPATLIAGIFTQTHAESIPELAIIPNPLTLRIKINHEPFHLSIGNIVGYERILNMKTAKLHRNILWLSPSGVLTRFQFTRFTSLTNPHILIIQLKFIVLTAGIHAIYIENSIGESRTRNGNLWSKLTATDTAEGIHITASTNQTGYEVALSSQLDIQNINGKIANHITSSDKSQQSVKFDVQDHQEVIVTKYVAIHTNQSTSTPLKAAKETLQTAIDTGGEILQKKHELAWKQAWDRADIRIEGDEIAQHALRFCTYHLLCAAPQQDQNTSIGAKTLSGTGYNGHIFWDTELFMLPTFTLTQPEIAKRLLMYRYNRLPGARKKATSMNYNGAMFPWESTDTGEETTPQWVNGDVSGKRIRIWTGDNEQHISSDIAYAVWQYWQWTGDDEWFIQFGAEIILDTAIFWASRVEYNKSLDRFELNNQIGPDEYHENVDNVAYTNYLVRWHLQRAVDIYFWLQQKSSDKAAQFFIKLNIDRQLVTRWKEIIDKLFIPIIEQDGNIIFEQFDGFFDLKLLDLNLYSPRTHNLYWTLSPEVLQNLQVIKQADVIMLLALFGHDLGDDDFLKNNWDIYSPLVDHGSSLSPAVHAWVAAQLGYTDEAYENFMQGALLDLENRNGNTELGIHAACCGAVWQAVIFGFCGVQISNSKIMTNPNLPTQWKSVSFNLYFRGKQHHFFIKNTL